MARVATMQARPRDDALLDGALEADVGVARALGAEIALGGEAGEQRGAGVIHGARGAQRQRLVQHLVVPAGLVVRMKKEMAVAFDQARESASRRRVRCGARSPEPADLCADGSDALTLDQHLPAECMVGAVEDPRRAPAAGIASSACATNGREHERQARAPDETLRCPRSRISQSSMHAGSVSACPGGPPILDELASLRPSTCAGMTLMRSCPRLGFGHLPPALRSDRADVHRR